MAPMQWLGTLEPRMSPFVQALNAMQPGVDAVAEWLRQQPERERQMLAALSGFIQSLPDQQSIDTFLSTIPSERAAALAEMSQRHGVGGFTLTPEGKLRVTLPTETLQRQQQWRLQQAQELLSPILGAPDEQREAWVASPEGQATLQRVRQVAPSFVMQRNGRLEPVQNVDDVLQRQLKGAQVKLTEAQAEGEKAGTTLKYKQVEQIDADIRNSTVLADAQKEHYTALTAQVRQQTADLAARHPFIVRLAQAELDEAQARISGILADAERTRTLTPHEAEQLQRQAENLEANTRTMLYNLDWLKSTEPLRYQQLQTDVATAEATLEKLRTENKWLEPMLELQRDQLRVAVQTDLENLNQLREQGPVKLATMRAQLEQLQEQLKELRDTRPERYKQLQVEVENAIKEGKLTDANVAVTYAQAKLYEAQAENVPKMQMLQEFIAKSNVDMETQRNLIELYRIEVSKEQAEMDNELQWYIAKNDAEIKRAQLSQQERQTRAYEMQIYGQYAPDVLLDMVWKDPSISDTTKTKLEKAIRAKATEEAFATASQYVNDLMTASATAGGFQRIWPSGNALELTLVLTSMLTGDMDSDAIIKKLQEDANAQQVAQQSAQGATDLTSLVMYTMAAGVGLSYLARTGIGRSILGRVGKAAAAGMGAGAAASAAPPPAPGAPALGAPVVPPALGAPPTLPALPPPSAAGKAIPQGNVPGGTALPLEEPVTGARTITLPSRLQPGKIPKGSQFVPLSGAFMDANEAHEMAQRYLRPEVVPPDLPPAPGVLALNWLWDHFQAWLKAGRGNGNGR